MKIMRLSTLFMAAFMLLAVSCAKDGETGPVGPVGPEGPPGNDGPGSGGGSGGGTQGPAGEDGNANVKAYTFTVTESDYAVYSDSLQTFFMHRDTLSIPEITTDVVNGGAVQVFVKGTLANNWNAMPFYKNRIAYNYAVGNGEVPVEISYNNGSAISVGDANYKVVVIPPANIKAGVDNTNYETLRAIYGIN